MMDHNNEAIVTEEKKYLNVLIVIFFLTIIGGGIWWLSQQPNGTADSTFVVRESVGVGFDEVPTAVTPPTGRIVFTQDEIKTDNAPPASAVHSYDVAAKLVSKISNQNAMAYISVSDNLAVIAKRGESDTKYTLGLLDTDTNAMTSSTSIVATDIRDIAVSTDKNMLAYSYATLASTTDAFESIDNWNTVVQTSLQSSTTDIILTGAVEPEWILNDTAIIFMKTDGLYRLELSTGAITLVADMYTDLTIYDDMDISPDGAAMVFARPTENTIKIISFNRNDRGDVILSERAEIYSDLISYSDPIFSPTGDFYSVIATTVQQIQSADNLPAFVPNIAIEVRALSASRVIQKYVVENPVIGGVRLFSWLQN